MQAVLTLKLSDDIKFEQEVQAVKCEQHLAVDISVDREEVRKAFMNTVSMSLTSIVDKTFESFDNAVELKRKELQDKAAADKAAKAKKKAAESAKAPAGTKPAAKPEAPTTPKAE